MKPAAGCLGIAQQRLGARKRVTVFQPGDGGLAGAHPGRQFGLRQPCAQASPEQRGGNLELRRERVILGLAPGVGEQPGFQLFELDGHRATADYALANPPYKSRTTSFKTATWLALRSRLAKCRFTLRTSPRLKR